MSSNGCSESDFEESIVSDSLTLRKFESCSGNSVVHFALDQTLAHAWPDRADKFILDFLLSFSKN